MSGGLIIHAMDSGPYHLHNHRRYLCFVSSGLQLPSYPAAFPPTFCNPLPMWRGHPTTHHPHLGKGYSVSCPVYSLEEPEGSIPPSLLFNSFLLYSIVIIRCYFDVACRVVMHQSSQRPGVWVNRLGLENHPLLLFHNYLGGSLTCSP